MALDSPHPDGAAATQHTQAWWGHLQALLLSFDFRRNAGLLIPKEQSSTAFSTGKKSTKLFSLLCGASSAATGRVWRQDAELNGPAVRPFRLFLRSWTR